MAKRSESKRPKGEQQPGKYPIAVGDNYLYWGEQPGYIYNPWTDSYIEDPTLQKQYAEQMGLVEKQEKPPGMLEVAGAQALPMLVSQAGLIGLENLLSPSAATAASAASAPGSVVGPSVGLTDAQINAVADMYSPQGGLLGIGGPPQGGVATPELLSVGQTAGAPAYMSPGQETITAGLEGLGVGSQTAGAVGRYAVPGVSSVLGALALKEGIEGRSPLTAGLGAAGMASGLGGLGAATGLLATNPITMPIAIGMGLLGAVAPKLLNRKKTGEYQKERWGAVSKDNSGWADYYDKSKSGTMPQVGAPVTKGADGSWVKPDGSWDPREYAGVLGNAETFGNDWFKLSEDKRNAAVSRFKDEGLYYGDKGDMRISDAERAKQIYNEIMGAK